MMMSWIDLRGRTAVVTGAGGGIGRGIASGLAAVGASVVLLDLQDQTAAVDEVVAAGGRATAIRCDVTSDDSVREARRAIAQQFEAPAILVNNAGTMRAGHLATLSITDWEAIMTLNLTAYLRCAQVFGEPMRQNGRGTIVHVASIAAHAPQSYSGAYSASKAAIVMLSRQLADEWGPHGVRSNVVSPGLIETPMTRGIYDTAGVREARTALVPRRRIGKPEDIANAVVFLASDRADYINGENIVVDGGLSHILMGVVPRPGFDRNAASGGRDEA
jgi:NAD(P)-dependent dehydrogenase (short-subunit alcohol dehydrogenase family)